MRSDMIRFYSIRSAIVFAGRRHRAPGSTVLPGASLAQSASALKCCYSFVMAKRTRNERRAETILRRILGQRELDLRERELKVVRIPGRLCFRQIIS